MQLCLMSRCVGCAVEIPGQIDMCTNIRLLYIRDATIWHPRHVSVGPVNGVTSTTGLPKLLKVCLLL